MSEKDVQYHQQLVNETGKFKFTIEETDVMRILLDGAEIELVDEEEGEPTLDLPILGGK